MEISTQLDSPRPARPSEFEAFLQTTNQVHRVDKGKPPDIAEAYPHIYNADNIENLLLITDGEKVICTVGAFLHEMECGDLRLRVGGINCLATLPEYRGSGLGATMMQAAQQHLRAQGCHIGWLETRITGWYRKLGWERAGAVRTYAFDDGNIHLLPPLPDDAKLQETNGDGLDRVLAIRRAEKLGSVRDQATFQPIYDARRQPAVFLVEQQGEAKAYLMVRNNAVLEWGGPAALVAGALRVWHQETCEGDEVITNNTPNFQNDLVLLLDEKRIPYSLKYAGMLYLLDPAAILKAARLRNIEISEEENEQFVLRRGNETLHASRAMLTKLFFGPERVSDFASDIFPLPFWQWPLENV